MASEVGNDDEDVLVEDEIRVSNTFVLHYDQKSEDYHLLCRPESGDVDANRIGWIFDRLHSIQPRDQTSPYLSPTPRPLTDLARERAIGRDKRMRYLLDDHPLLPHLNEFDAFLAKTERFNADLTNLQKELARAYRDPFISRLRKWSRLIGKLPARSPR